MNKLNKNYLVIKNVQLDKNLTNYLEQICEEENVGIVYEEVGSFDLFNQKKSIYAEFNANQTKDILLWSYNISKLEYINYLYADFEARYKIANKAVGNILKEAGAKTSPKETISIPRLDYVDYISLFYIDDIEKSLDEYFLFKDQKNMAKKDLGAWATGDWKIAEPQKKPTFKQKIFNFYNKHEEKLAYIMCGFIISNLFCIISLILKYFMVK